MRYGQIRKYDVANGPGIRTSLFVTGCPFNCEGCFNREYGEKTAGKPWTQKQEDEIMEYLKLEQVSGLSVLGGEPLAQDYNLLKLLKRAKKEAKKDIWLWSGFCFEELTSKQKKVLEFVDILVDGPFILAEKDYRLKFRGSKNQRIIDLKRTKETKNVCIWSELKKGE